MPTHRARVRNAPSGLTRSPAELVEWAAVLALSSDVVACCDCDTCKRAEALVAARRLRELGRPTYLLRKSA